METTVLVAVAKRRLCVGAPFMFAAMSPGVLMVSLYIFKLHILLAILIAGAFHGFFCLMAFKDRYFDQVLLAYLRRPRTKSLLPVKGHRYVGR